jgi:hypothetical protein
VVDERDSNLHHGFAWLRLPTFIRGAARPDTPAISFESPDFGEQFEASDNFRTSLFLIEITNLQIRPYPNA